MKQKKVRMMKLSNLFFILFVIILFFIASCKQNQKDEMENMARSNENEDLEFKKMCQDAGYEWMLMKPTKDGKIIKEAKSCLGCMVEGVEHVCDMEKFEEMMKTGMETGMNSMQHMAMTAHAGNRNSVDVYMYKVGFARPNAEAGKESLLRFTINEMHSGKPISNLGIVHDKIMHVVLVRNDLKHFDHVHPEMNEAGIFSAPYIFSSSGLYRIWVDFTIDGMQHIIDFDINVPSNLEAGEKDMLNGIKVNFKSPKEIMAGKEIDLEFEIFDENNKPIAITEKFLGANAHLIDIDEKLEEFDHNHDEKFDKDNVISFRHEFSKSGRHRLWVQFLVNNRVKTASFDLMVTEQNEK